MARQAARLVTPRWGQEGYILVPCVTDLLRKLLPAACMKEVKRCRSPAVTCRMEEVVTGSPPRVSYCVSPQRSNYPLAEPTAHFLEILPPVFCTFTMEQHNSTITDTVTGTDACVDAVRIVGFPFKKQKKRDNASVLKVAEHEQFSSNGSCGDAARMRDAH